jgi:type II secretory pathway pseudopilin PulG
MKRTASGMVLLELLLAIAVVGLMTTAGFRAFASLGEILHRRNASLVEAARVSGLETSLRGHGIIALPTGFKAAMAVDRRCPDR